jgi:alkanesulfonate monooxygenase SsuD/methylene tetrahydromethanopterin reductase-like flavin-dependent oxidoreductase (luciferase family)
MTERARATENPYPRIGVQLNTTQRVFRWTEIRELARAVEDAGLDSVWSEDHILYQSKRGESIAPWDAWTVLAGLAEVTDRVRIGTLVSPLGLRHPVLLARHAASVQEISGGRLVLGLGLGWGEREYRTLGMTLEHRFGRFREAFEILMSALEEGTADQEGQHVSTEAFQLLPRPEGYRRPALMIGSDGPKTLRLTLPRVEAWNWDGFVDDVTEFAAASRAVDAICEDVGRDPREVERTAHLVVRLSNAEGLPIDPLPPHLRVIEGGTDAVAARLQAFADAGADELMLIVDPARPAAIEELARAVELTRTRPPAWAPGG